MAMAPASPSIHKALLFSYLMTTFVFSSSLTTATTSAAPNNTANLAKPARLVAKLIHCDSIHSPYYNPNDTTWDRARRAIDSSTARFACLNSKKTPSEFSTNDYRAGVIPEDNGAAFLANISIGQPPVIQFMVMDTGSDLLWAQCLPCIQCFEQKDPIFDPSKSSTNVSLSCDSPCCIVSPLDRCDEFNHCKYSQLYIDGTLTKGDLATEMLTLETSDEGIIAVPDVVIGCAHVNSIKNGLTSGILGLGPLNISLVSKLGSKFSYCFGNVRDPFYGYNHLAFDDGAIMEGDETSFEFFHNHYYLTLEGISIGEKRLNIDPATFERTPWGSSGTVIDTGSTYTFLPKDAYKVIRDEVQRLAEGLVQRGTLRSHPEYLCHWGILSSDLEGFPVVTFHFDAGAELDLDIHSLFEVMGPNQFCMAIREVRSVDELAIIGVLAHQYYNVAYDLVAKKVYSRGLTASFFRK